MKPKCQELLSNFAFNCNLRHCTKLSHVALGQEEVLQIVNTLVGPCSLTLGFAQLTLRLLSALETKT